MSFITVSKLREDGDYDVLVAYNEDMDTEEETDTEMEDHEADYLCAQASAEHYKYEYGMVTGEELHVHRVETPASVLDGEEMDGPNKQRYRVPAQYY